LFAPIGAALDDADLGIVASTSPHAQGEDKMPHPLPTPITHIDRREVLAVMDHRIEDAKAHPMMPRAVAELLDCMAAMIRDLDNRTRRLEVAYEQSIAL
jgi:hypothetical protein